MFYILDTVVDTGGNLLRPILFGICQSLYDFIGQTYTFLLQIAGLSSIVKQTANFDVIINKIYMLIGIVMLFRLGIVLLQYIANPDKVANPKDGITGNIVPRVLTTLVMLVFTPTLFGWLYEIQKTVISEQIIENFFAPTIARNIKNEVTSSDEYENVYDDYLNGAGAPSCLFVRDPDTNGLCFQYPFDATYSLNFVGTGTSAGVSGLGSYEYTRPPMNFCPDKILVYKNDEDIYYKGKIMFASADGSKQYTLSGDYAGNPTYNYLISSATGCFVKNDYNLEGEHKAVGGDGTMAGIKLTIPTLITGFSYVRTSTQAGVWAVFEETYTCATAGVECDIPYRFEFVKTNDGLNNANFILSNYNSKYTDDKYNDSWNNRDKAILHDHPYGLTVKIEELAAQAEEYQAEIFKSTRTGSKFADILFMAFISPNGKTASAGDVFDQFDKQKELFTKKIIVNGKTIINDYADPLNQVDYSVLSNLVNEKNPEFPNYYAFEFSGLIAIIAAIVVIIMLFATLFKVAIRIFKLLMLEILAPIPIIMNLDPSNMKPGESSLEKWFKALTGTYIDLFVRLFVIGFVNYFIAQLSNVLANMGPTVSVSSPALLILFLIFGLLMFMNIASEFLAGFVPFKAEAGGFNPLKQMTAVPGLNKTLSTATGAAGGAFKGAVQGGIGGAAAGLFLGAKAGMASKGGPNGFAAGRDTTASALESGPSARGGILERFAQTTASTGMRAGANSYYNQAEALKAPRGTFDTSKKSFTAADNAVNTREATIAQFERERKLHQSEADSYTQQGLHGQAAASAVQVGIRNASIATEEASLLGEKVTRSTAAAAYNTEISKHNSLYDKYVEEMKTVNVRTGKDSTGYAADKGVDGFKKIDKV